MKHFDPEHTMTDDEVRNLLRYTVLAPTSFNIQNRHFVCVRDRAVKQELQKAAFNQRQVGDCSLVVAITGNDHAHRATHRYLRHAPDEVRNALEPMILSAYDDDADALAAETCRSTGLAAMVLMLVALDMGYDTCPMIGFDPKGVSTVLGLPPHCAPQLLVTVGKALEPAHPRLGLLSLDETVSLDRFGNHGFEGEVDL